MNASEGKQKRNIYAAMSDSFTGNPDRAILEMSTRRVLGKYGKPHTKQAIYELGSIMFVLSRRTGIAEIDILDCVVESKPARTLELAAGRCAGVRDFSVSRTI